MDNQIELVCGAFSADPEKSRVSGAELFLPPDRVYGSYHDMIRTEKGLPPDRRMDFVSIVTPNFMHFPAAKEALENGFPVMCDKPMTFSLREAHELEALVAGTGLLFGLSHNYTGYPMVKEARQTVAAGRLGKIRKIVVEYPQGWLSTPKESMGDKQASWRTDPGKAGLSSCMGDIGTHAENLAEYVTGLRIEELCADLTAFVEGRQLEDDGNVLLRMEGGAKGVLYASQVAAGEENPLTLRVYGEKGGLAWRQEEPNSLTLLWPDRPREILRPGTLSTWLSEEARRNTRLPAGHPEGFLEAFANLYRNYAMTLRCRLSGREPDPAFLDFPTVKDGVRGMAFIETVVESAKSDRKWVRMKA
jgi:predicted dehydrogenase